MKTKLILGLAGLLALSSPAIEGSEKFKHPFGNRMILRFTPQGVILYYNPNNDENFDVRMGYINKGFSLQGNPQFDLAFVLKDLDKDKKTGEDEMIYQNPKYFPREEEPYIPDAEKSNI